MARHRSYILTGRTTQGIADFDELIHKKKSTES